MKIYSLKIILLVASLWLPLSAQAAKNILVFGDSLSAGYGIAVAESWPSLLQKELERKGQPYRVVNASISGETTVGGRQRIAKALKQHKPAIVIVELGANDGLRGANPKDIETNLGKIIEQAQRAKAKVLLVGMQLPPNYGPAYTEKFHNIFPKLARKHRVSLLPFLLDGVSPEQFQPDNLHPTAEAQPHIMDSAFKELAPLLH